MTGLVDKHGNPLSSADFQNKKAVAPPLGERYGRWAGDNSVPFLQMPGGGALAFNTANLTLADFRQMKGHYQINSSLSVLTFMMHQMDWHIECEKQKVADLVEVQLRRVWSRLVRAKSQALWAGYSPNVLEWENDYTGREVVLNKVKDLIPEDCRVHWKEITNTVPRHPSEPKGVPGGRKATFKIYDGIDQSGGPSPIPVANSYWYPMLMENGNYYGRRLLESAFQPWFFSMLMHLFANRYYERFGEPTPVGRAPFDDEIDVNGVSMKGNKLMALVIQQLRNRSTVVLPSDKTPAGDETNPSYDYQLEYLESQMRGADFERYMTRLDEEMSLAMFTPILMMRTADVGSYNLGTQHTQVYQWMLNAISGDWADYINKYIIKPIIAYNFNGNPIEARIKFTRMGKTSGETLQAIITHLLSSGAAKVDTREIGEMAGLTITEIEQTQDSPTPPPDEQPVDPSKDGQDQTNQIKSLIIERVKPQVERAMRNGDFDSVSFQPQLGYKRQLSEAMKKAGKTKTGARVDDMYEHIENWCNRVIGTVDAGETVEDFMIQFENKVDEGFRIFVDGEGWA